MAQDSDSSSDDFGWLDSLFKSPPPVIPASEGLQSQYGPVGTEMLGPQQMGMPAPGGFDPVVNAGLLGLGGRPVTASRLATMQNTLGATAGLGNADMGVAGTFAGPMARGANLAKMKLAQAMDRWGASPTMIKNQTGWDKNAASQWRYELPDNNMMLNPEGTVQERNPTYGHYDLSSQAAVDKGPIQDKTIASIKPWGRADTGVTSTKLGQVIEHPELFDAYPQLKDLEISGTNPNSGFLGMYTPTINLSDKTIPARMNMAPAKEGQFKDTLVHEIQHAVQDIEGAPFGATPEWYGQTKIRNPADPVIGSFSGATPDNLYHQTAGEVEARTSQDRRMLTGQDREYGLALDDVARGNQINLLPTPDKTGVNLSMGHALTNENSTSIKVPAEDMSHPEYKQYLQQLVLSGYKAVSPRGSSIVEFKR